MIRLKIREQNFSFNRAVIMGIVNVTPDSFYDGGNHQDTESTLKFCEGILEQGADIIDIGAFSTRPQSSTISPAQESSRLIPSLKAIRQRFPDALISIDTFRQSVAEQAINEGADIINDISGGTFDEKMIPYIGENHIPYILMHITGTLETMHKNLIDDNVCEIVKNFFEEQTAKLLSYGEQQIILDPGIGFNKTIRANFELLNNIEKYRINDYPVLIGISRKSMIYKTLNITPQEALNGTTVLNTIALMKGADILRVHDVKEAVETRKLVELSSFRVE